MMNRTKTLQRRESLFYALLAFALITFFSLPQKVNAQTFEKLGNGVADTVIASCMDSNDNYYVVYVAKYNWPNNTWQVSKWDGNSWFNYPGISLQNYKGINRIKIYNGQIHLAGNISTKDSQKVILRFNNQKWDSLLYKPYTFSYHDYYYSDDLTVFQNKLYINYLEQIFIWDGKNMTEAKNSNSKKLISGNIITMHPTKDYLYIGGEFTMVDSINCNAIAKWDGNKWSSETNHLDMVYLIASLQNKIIAFGYSYYSMGGYNKRDVIVKENNTWSSIKDSSNYFHNYANHISLTNYNDKFLYIWSNDYNSMNPTLTLWDGYSWKHWKIEDKFSNTTSRYPYFSLNSTKDKLFLAGSFQKINNDTFNFVTEIKLKPQVQIKGKVFLDDNGNCIQNSNEKGLGGQIIKVNTGPDYIKTDALGNYTYWLDSGNNSLSVLINNYEYKQICPGKYGYVNLLVNPDSSYTNLDFGLQILKDPVTDVKVNVSSYTGFRARVGFFENYKISFENIGTTDIDSGSINLSYPKNISKFSSIPAFDNHPSGIATWSYKNLKVGEKRNIYFTARVDSAGRLNDTVKFVVFTDNNIYLKDTDKVNNSDTLFQRLVAAIDPNDKQAYPDSNIVPGTKELRYYIRFQNTGNDTAYKIVVKDTLDKNVVISGFEMIGSSHEYTLDTTNGILTWTFNNILLPDSNTNEPLSHGYISYKVKLKDSLAIGTEIRNTAYIYFDFQPAVITNTTLNTIKSKVIVTAIQQEEIKQINPGLKVYPNPAISSFFIENKSAERQNLSMINMMGQIVKVIQVNAGEKAIIDASQLPKGMYFIKSTDNVNSASIKVLIQQ